MQTNGGESITSDLHSPRWTRRLTYESGPTGWAPPPAQKILTQDCWGLNHLALTNSGTGTESRICYPNKDWGTFSYLRQKNELMHSSKASHNQLPLITNNKTQTNAGPVCVCVQHIYPSVRRDLTDNIKYAINKS